VFAPALLRDRHAQASGNNAVCGGIKNQSNMRS
jgi:hypothetical protein